jgi:hypothetical protein
MRYLIFVVRLAIGLLLLSGVAAAPAVAAAGGTGHTPPLAVRMTNLSVLVNAIGSLASGS